MIANFFNKSTPLTTFVVFIIISLVVLVSIFTTPTADFSLNFFLKKIGILFFLIITLFLVQFITKKNGLIKDNSYDLLLMVLFVTMFPRVIDDIRILMAHFILLFAFRRIYSLRTIKNTKEKLFDSSFYIGIASLIYPLSALYIVLPYAAVINFNKRTIRNVIIPLVGFITPLIIYLSYVLLFSNFDALNFDLTLSFLYTNYNTLNLLIPITLLLGFMIWVIFPTTIKIVTSNSDLKNLWYVLLTHLVISILIIIPAPTKNGSEFVFLFFPAAILFANYLQMVKEKWFKDVFLYLLAAAAIVSSFL